MISSPRKWIHRANNDDEKRVLFLRSLAALAFACNVFGLQMLSLRIENFELCRLKSLQGQLAENKKKKFRSVSVHAHRKLCALVLNFLSKPDERLEF